MAKLTAQQKKDLISIGITKAKTVEEAMEAMKEFLAGEGIDGLDTEGFDEIYEMASLMYSDSDAQKDDLSEEAEEEEETEEEETEEEDEDEDEDELPEEEEDEDEDELPEEEEDEEEAPKSKKVTKKAAAKPAAKKTVTKKSTGKSNRLNPKEVKADAAEYDDLIEAIKAFSPKSEFIFNFIANGGLTVKFLGNNGSRAFFSFDSPKRKDKDILARTYIPSIRNQEKLEEIFGTDYEMKPDWSTNILVHDVSLAELTKIFKSKKKPLTEILDNLGKKDEKLGKNREKMEKDLNEGKKAAAKKVIAKKATSKKEADAPKKVVKKATTKKVVKKTSKK